MLCYNSVINLFLIFSGLPHHKRLCICILILRTRTPSGSSTPIPTGAKVLRKTSGASDTPTGLSRKGSSASTPTEKRAPFRL